MHIKRLVDMVERNLEALWEKDREEYIAGRDEINAIRRLRPRPRRSCCERM